MQPSGGPTLRLAALGKQAAERQPRPPSMHALLTARANTKHHSPGL